MRQSVRACDRAAVGPVRGPRRLGAQDGAGPAPSSSNEPPASGAPGHSIGTPSRSASLRKGSKSWGVKVTATSDAVFMISFLSTVARRANLHDRGTHRRLGEV